MTFKLDPEIADELRHYGVKGMKWGVRKDRDPSVRSQARKRRSDIRKENKARTARKDPRSMTDSELNASVNRMNLEKRYKDLSDGRDNLVIRTGTRVVTDILYEVSKEVLKDIVKNKLKEATNGV